MFMPKITSEAQFVTNGRQETLRNYKLIYRHVTLVS